MSGSCRDQCSGCRGGVWFLSLLYGIRSLCPRGEVVVDQCVSVISLRFSYQGDGHRCLLINPRIAISPASPKES